MNSFLHSAMTNRLVELLDFNEPQMAKELLMKECFEMLREIEGEVKFSVDMVQIIFNVIIVLKAENQTKEIKTCIEALEDVYKKIKQNLNVGSEADGK